MAWVKQVPYVIRRPSFWLGFLLLGLISFGVSLYFFEKTGVLLFRWHPQPLGLEKGHGVAVFAAFIAAIGWNVTALVTLRNSVKQHTINTLLQSRLSATYMEHVKAANATFCTPNGELIPLTKEEVKNPPAGVTFTSLGYMLNYLEFIAVGIRHGDLDEAVLKNSLRGIVCSLYCVAFELIQARRAQVQDPKQSRTYENLCWLHERWKDDAQLPPRVLRVIKKPPTQMRRLSARSIKCAQS